MTRCTSAPALRWVAGPLLLAALLFAACDDVMDDPGDDEQAALTMEQQQTLSRVQDALCDSDAFIALADSVVADLRATFDTREATPDSAMALVAQPDLNHASAHDCQRLVSDEDSTGTPMGDMPLAALLVSTERVSSGDFATGLVVAEIVNYGPGDYEPLGIPADTVSCLWLQGTRNTWMAAIFPSPAGSCIGQEFDQQRDPDTAPSLTVNRLRIADGDTAYPSTGRWMWDATARQQFIGIRCGDGWCEIGEAGFNGTEAIPTWADVPGRWDEQLLARQATPGGPLTLSDLLGRVEPGADNTAAADRNPQNWAAAPPADSLHVATLDFSHNSGPVWAQYARKFALDQGKAVGHGILMSTVVDSNGETVRRLRSRQGPWTQVRRSAQTHSGSGTVRWAWREDDEGFWVPCDAGCCISTGLRGT